MKPALFSLACLAPLLCGAIALGQQPLKLQFPPSDRPGELTIEASFFLWTPPNAKTIRGVIVHQHGCGDGAERGGETAAYDLHWQALAEKWDCALLGSRYRALGDCKTWYDPENGSAAAFVKALQLFAKQTGHPEIAHAPWALWGHSGGSVWVYRMFEKFPNRTLAVFMRSGRPTFFENREEIGRIAEVTDAKRAVPILCNLGLKERDNERFSMAWKSTIVFLNVWRPQGARVAFAPDPLTAHQCGNSRYLAIPFFDAILAARLPKAGETTPRPLDPSKAWLGNRETFEITPANQYQGDASLGCWLPNEHVALVWQEFVKTGEVKDRTPPLSAPVIISAKPASGMSVELTWRAAADFQSGIRAFAIYRDDRQIAIYQPQTKAQFSISQFQQISYHDTPILPLPQMRYIDTDVEAGATYRYRIATINGYELASPKSKAIEVSVPAR